MSASGQYIDVFQAEDLIYAYLWLVSFLVRSSLCPGRISSASLPKLDAQIITPINELIPKRSANAIRGVGRQLQTDRDPCCLVIFRARYNASGLGCGRPSASHLISVPSKGTCPYLGAKLHHDGF